MIAEFIERQEIAFPDQEARFNGNGPVVRIGRGIIHRLVPPPEARPSGFTKDGLRENPVKYHIHTFNGYRGAGRPPAERATCLDGEHHWVSKGERQARCTKCKRTSLKHLLGPDERLYRTNAPTIKTPPVGPTTPCPASPEGHHWLSKGAKSIRCSLCRKCAKRINPE